MTGSVCPTCKAPIDDPARAPVARIRGSRVVSFCSAECAAAGDDGEATDAGDDPVRVESSTNDADRPDTPIRVVTPRPRGSRKRKIIALSAAIMAGGMVITIVNAISPSTPSNVSAAGNRGQSRIAAIGAENGTADPDAPEDLAAGDPDVPGDDTPPVTADELYEQAQETLRTLLDSPSSRVKRITAMALSRTRDPRAVAHLTTLLDEKDNNLMRVEAAYALARIGDARAREILYDYLGHSRRDVRVDAARSLVQLGDPRGGKVLRRMLSLRTHRLGAAEQLGRLRDRDGMRALREALDSDKSSDETRMRALVALGRAGEDSVRERLVAILTDGRYQIGAADALATLGDQRAIPPLTRQLRIASLRVRAALALRRFGAEVEFAALARALVHGSDQARVSAAEAALVLAGPKELSEYD